MHFLTFSRNLFAYLFFAAVFTVTAAVTFLFSENQPYSIRTEDKKSYKKTNITGSENFSHEISLIFGIKIGQPVRSLIDRNSCPIFYFFICFSWIIHSNAVNVAESHGDDHDISMPSVPWADPKWRLPLRIPECYWIFFGIGVTFATTKKRPSCCVYSQVASVISRSGQAACTPVS